MTTSTRIFRNFLSLVSSRKVWMMVLVILSLSMIGVANLEINGSTTPQFINSTLVNLTINQGTNNLELRQQVDDYISYWRADGSGNDENRTSARDIILYNGSDYNTSGKYNSAFYTDGINDYILLPNSSNHSGASRFTISFWVLPLESWKTGNTLYYETNDTDGSTRIGIDYTNGKARCWIKDQTGTSFVVQDTVNISLTDFTHLACTYNSSNDVLKLYKNGGNVSINTVGKLNLNLGAPHNPITLGSLRYDSIKYYVKALFDDIRFYDYDQSNDEINLTINQSKYSSGYIKSWYNSSPNISYQIDVNGTNQTNSNVSLQVSQNGSSPSSFEAEANQSLNHSWAISGFTNTDIYVWLFGNGTSTPQISNITLFDQVAEAGSPNITSYYNSLSGWNDSRTTYRSSNGYGNSVFLNITSNQSGTISWFKDDVNQSWNYDNITLNWSGNNGAKTVKVNVTNANGTSQTIQWNVTVVTGIPPNLLGITQVYVNTTWDNINVNLGGNLIMSYYGAMRSFNILNSTINTTYSIYTVDDESINFTLENSTINLKAVGTYALLFDAELGYPKISENAITIGYVSNTAYPNIIKINNSVISGLNSTQFSCGLLIKTGGPTVVPKSETRVNITNSTFKWLGGLYTGGGSKCYAISTRYWSTGNLIANGSTIHNITLISDGAGIFASPNLDIYNINATGGAESFEGGRNWNNVRGEGVIEMLDGSQQYGSVINNSYFDAIYTKLNFHLLNNALFDNNTVINAAFNIGAGGDGCGVGCNNTISNNIFIGSGVGEGNDLKRYIKILNNTFTGSAFSDHILSLKGGYCTVTNNTFQDSDVQYGMELTPITGSYLVFGNCVFRDNILRRLGKDSIYINMRTNNTFYNTTISDSKGYNSITIINSSSQIFIDTNITNTSNGNDISITSGTNDNNSHKFINTFFTLSKVSTGSGTYFNNYYYSDINVINLTGSPISGATITFINTVNPSYPSINRAGTITASYTTDSSGHTPLPVGNDSTTVVLMNMSKNSTTTQKMNYTVNVNDSSFIYPNINTSINSTGYNSPQQPVASTTITPNSSWYRSNPNTYQNTTIIQLPASTNWSILPSTTISVNASSDKNLTASWTGSATVLFNTTIPEWASTTLYLKHDGTTVDTKASNGTGFVNFSYTGTNGTFNVSNVSAPNITSWQNNKTLNSTSNFTVNLSESVKFNITANQTITTYNWYKDNVNQSVNFNNITISWSVSGLKTIKVNATSADGTSPTIQWNVTVNIPTPTNLANYTPTSSSVDINWSSVTGATAYQVFKNATSLGTTTNTYYNVTGLTASTEYNFTVRANDSDNNWGANSTNLTIRTIAASVTEETTASAGGGSSGGGGSGWAIETLNKTTIQTINTQNQEEAILSLNTNNFTFYYKPKSPLTLKVYDISFMSECETIKLTASNTDGIVSVDTSCKITNPNIRFIVPNTQIPDSVYYKVYDLLWIKKPSVPTDITQDGLYLAVRVESGAGQYKFMQYDPLYEVQQIIASPIVILDILKEMDKELYKELSKRIDFKWSY